jgi:hypothetical protein
MIYYLGIILGRRFRLWYWRTHKDRWHWGLVRAAAEIPIHSPHDVRDPLDDFINGLLK